MRSSVLVAALLVIASPAHAFLEAAQFFDQPGTPHAATLQPSSEGVYFTGSPRFAGLTCSSCHVEGPQRVRLRIGADDLTLFNRGYVPGRTYALEVQLLDEQMGRDHNRATCTEVGSMGASGYVPCNNNGFALEIDAGGKPLKSGFCAGAKSGGPCAAPDDLNDEVVIAPDGDAVFANRAHDATDGRVVLRNGQASWHFSWTAPVAGTGPLTIYVAAVDGNGGAGTAANDQDPEGDDVVEGAIPVAEAGALPADPATVSCAVARGAGRPPSPAALVVVVAASLGWLLARVRRRRGAAQRRG